jgi:hypothetical protein
VTTDFAFGVNQFDYDGFRRTIANYAQARLSVITSPRARQHAARVDTQRTHAISSGNCRADARAAHRGARATDTRCTLPACAARAPPRCVCRRRIRLPRVSEPRAPRGPQVDITLVVVTKYTPCGPDAVSNGTHPSVLMLNLAWPASARLTPARRRYCLFPQLTLCETFLTVCRTNVYVVRA